MDSLPPVEGSPKPIPKSANLRPRASNRAMSEAKDRAPGGGVDQTAVNALPPVECTVKPRELPKRDHADRVRIDSSTKRAMDEKKHRVRDERVDQPA